MKKESLGGAEWQALTRCFNPNGHVDTSVVGHSEHPVDNPHLGRGWPEDGKALKQSSRPLHEHEQPREHGLVCGHGSLQALNLRPRHEGDDGAIGQVLRRPE